MEWPGDLTVSAAPQPWVQLSHSSPGTHTWQPLSLLVLLGSMAHWLSVRPRILCRGQVCGPGRRSQGHVLRFLVSGPGPSSCVLAWPQVLHPWGLNSLKRNAVPSQGGQQGQRGGLKPHHPHVGNSVAAHCKAVGMVALTVLSPGDQDTLG